VKPLPEKKSVLIHTLFSLEDLKTIIDLGTGIGWGHANFLLRYNKTGDEYYYLLSLIRKEKWYFRRSFLRLISSNAPTFTQLAVDKFLSNYDLFKIRSSK
jgi:hypothetical protein